MYKVFIVEDDAVELEQLKNLINWTELGLKLVGDAQDGEIAYPMIEKCNPDIVILDVTMPYMNGLQLGHLLRKVFPRIELMIVTKRRDFEIAKECISIGVTSYLTKPVDTGELKQELIKIKERLEERERESEYKRKYQKVLNNSTQQERLILLQSILSNNKTMPEILELAGQLQVDISAIWYNVIILQLRGNGPDVWGKSDEVFRVEQRMQELLVSERMLFFETEPIGKIIIFKGDSEEELRKFQDNYLAEFRQMMEDFPQIKYYGGIGMPVNRMREIGYSYHKAEQAIAQPYFDLNSSIVDSVHLRGNSYSEPEEYDIGEIDPKLFNKERVMEFLKLSGKEEVEGFTEEFFYGFGEALSSDLLRQYLIISFYFCVAEFVEELQVSRREIERPERGVLYQKNISGAMEYTRIILCHAIEVREKQVVNRYKDIMQEMIHCIEENYMDADFSLNQLAEKIKFSPNHLSMVFRKEMGQTFSKYLTEFRMNKAKELLRCTNKKSGVIAMEVGYKDSHYFTYLFKKTQGVTPLQWRNGYNS